MKREEITHISLPKGESNIKAMTREGHNNLHKPNKQPFSIRIDQKLLKKIRITAEREKRTVTNLVEYVMEQYCDGKL